MSDQPIEAEVVPSQAVAVRPQTQTGLATVADLEQQFALAVRQRELLSEYIKKQLVPGKHFYQRGDQKPSLSKEGAEIILLPHNLAPDYEQTGGPDKPPEDGRPYQITVKCILRRKGDPNSFVGSGIGSAGSEHRNRDGKYTPRQPDKYLCHNATLKMAQKSAMIAATINSTAASEFFTQDMSPEEVAHVDTKTERNASNCPVIGVFDPNEYNTLLNMPKGNPVQATEEEGAILLRRLCQHCLPEQVLLAEPKGKYIALLWHKGGGVRIKGEHRLVGEGLCGVPGTIAIMLLRHGDSKGRQTVQGRSDNGQAVGNREGVPGEQGQKVLGHTGDSGGGQDPLRRPASVKVPLPPSAYLAKFIINLDEASLREKATQFLIDLAWLMPNERLEDLKPDFTPMTKEQYVNFLAKLANWSVSGKAEKPYERNTEPEPGKKPIEVPREASKAQVPEDEEASSQPWYNVIVPIPRKGMKRDDYLRNPDTIGSLYSARHDDEEARKRLFGFANNFQPKPWVGNDGKERPPSKTDVEFRDWLDQFLEFYDKAHPNEKL